MKYRTLILDFDGTLADTKKSIIDAMKFVANGFNVKGFDEKTIESLIGLPLKTTFENAFLFDKSQIAEATLMYRKHYNQNIIDSISLFENVKETLLELYHQGINLTIASSKGKEALIKVLKKEDIYYMFSFVGGEEDVKNKKPSPDIVNHIIYKYKYKPEECLVVGDTIFDIEMGQRGNVDTCGVTYGNNTREKLEEKEPDYIIDSFNELKDIIKQNAS